MLLHAPELPRSADDRGLARPGLLDLRLHSPIPPAMIIRVAGVIDEPAEVLVRNLVCQHVRRFTHVVLDLSQAQDMQPSGIRMLLDLHRIARSEGATLHITGTTDHDAIEQPLRLAGADQFLTLAPDAETVVALLTR